VEKIIMQICARCNIEKDLSKFSNSQQKNGGICRNCVSIYNKHYRQDNKEYFVEYEINYRKNNWSIILERTSEYRKQYYQENKKELAEYQKQYQAENKEKLLEQKKEYYQDNKESIREYKKGYVKERRKNDPIFKIHRNVSRMIHAALKNNGSSKKGESVEPNLSGAFQEMRFHLENGFLYEYNLTSDGKVWMTWSNWGRYDSKTWDDNDPSTWTWQIDHIIPQSDLPYETMQEENFKKCWALENLRPLSAKQNWLDGVTKTRHKK
jgi:hypothetical protein